MSYGNLIAELFERSGMQVNTYAEAIDISVAHLSNIINGNQPGSRKILESALDQAGMSLEGLCLPEPDAQTQREKDLLKRLRKLSERRQVLLIDVADQLVAAEKTEKKPPRKSPLCTGR